MVVILKLMTDSQHDDTLLLGLDLVERNVAGAAERDDQLAPQ